MSSVTNPARGGQNNPSGQSKGTMERGKEKEGMGSDLGQTMQDAASYVGEKAKTATSSAVHSAQEAASYVGKRADEGAAAVGSTIKSFGDTVRHAAPARDMMKDATCAVADTLENTGRYLEEEGLTGMAEDVTNLIKRNPIPALFIGIGVGFLLARALTSRSY